MNRKIVGMGEILWDVLPEGKKIGGAPANFAYHLSQFGFDSCAVSAVGDDVLGDEILETFRRKGVPCRIEKVPYPTGTVQVELDGAGIPRYEIRTDVAWDYIPFTPALEALARETQAVCFGSLAQRSPVSRRTIARFLDTMPDGADRYKIFDINLRQDFYDRELFCSSLERCNILKINDEELAVLDRMFGFSAAGPEEVCRMLMTEYRLNLLILTCGTEGSYVFAPEETSFVATPRVEVADTVGAGDSFIAAFCSALLKNRSVREAHELAVAVSAFVCSQHGAMPELPDSLKNRLW